jgi:methylmalonyl-CoA epimerase
VPFFTFFPWRDDDLKSYPGDDRRSYLNVQSGMQLNLKYVIFHHERKCMQMNWQELKVHHIGIVVEDINDAKKPYETVLGMEVIQIYDVDAFAARVAFLPVSNTYIELVQPTNPNDGLGRFLQKGGGVHHICYEVENIDDVVQQMKAKKIRLIPDEPKWTPCFDKTLFLHPKDTGNVLVELVEKASCPLPPRK